MHSTAHRFFHRDINTARRNIHTRSDQYSISKESKANASNFTAGNERTTCSQKKASA